MSCIRALVSFKNQLNLLFYLQLCLFHFIGCQLTTCDERWKRDIGANIYSVNCTSTTRRQPQLAVVAHGFVHDSIDFSIDCKSVIQVVCATPNACYKWHLFIDRFVIFLTTLLTGPQSAVSAYKYTVWTLERREKMRKFDKSKCTRTIAYSLWIAPFGYEKIEIRFSLNGHQTHTKRRQEKTLQSTEHRDPFVLTEMGKRQKAILGIGAKAYTRWHSKFFTTPPPPLPMIFENGKYSIPSKASHRIHSSKKSK